jgi:hypothetical protein
VAQNGKGRRQLLQGVYMNVLIGWQPSAVRSSEHAVPCMNVCNPNSNLLKLRQLEGDPRTERDGDEGTASSSLFLLRGGACFFWRKRSYGQQHIKENNSGKNEHFLPLRQHGPGAPALTRVQGMHGERSTM